MTTTHYRHVPSPVGQLTIAGIGDTLMHLDMVEQTHLPSDRDTWKRDTRAFGDVAEQLAAYFAGDLTSFSLTYDLAGTPFQRRVWSALEKIPYGQTRSYGAVAATIGAPKAYRAVGTANGHNPIAIIVPCHRVIATGGGLGGYGGGLARKVTLLSLEQSHVASGGASHGHRQRVSTK